MPRSDSPNLQRMETLVCKIAELEEAVKGDEALLGNAKIDLVLMICQVPNESQQSILTERYMNGKPWSEIVKTLGFSRSRIFTFHEDALCKVESLLANDTLNAAE